MCVISYFVPSVSLSKLYFIERAPVDRSYVRDQIASDPARDRSGDERKRPPRRLLSLRHDTRRRLDAVLDPSARAFVHPERKCVVGFDGTAREPSAKSPSRVRVTSEGEPSARHLRRKMRATAWERKRVRRENVTRRESVTRRRTFRARANTGRALSSSLREYGHL